MEDYDESGGIVEAEALSYLAHVQELSRHHEARVSRLNLARPQRLT